MGILFKIHLKRKNDKFFCTNSVAEENVGGLTRWWAYINYWLISDWLKDSREIKLASLKGERSRKLCSQRIRDVTEGTSTQCMNC